MSLSRTEAISSITARICLVIGCMQMLIAKLHCPSFFWGLGKYQEMNGTTLQNHFENQWIPCEFFRKYVKSWQSPSDIAMKSPNFRNPLEIQATWDWRRVQSLAREAPQAQGLSGLAPPWWSRGERRTMERSRTGGKIFEIVIGLDDLALFL